MGEIKELKCKDCGNVWTHYMGVGFKMKPVRGSKKDNITGDADKVIKCPKCDSRNFNEEEDRLIGMWD